MKYRIEICNEVTAERLDFVRRHDDRRKAAEFLALSEAAKVCLFLNANSNGRYYLPVPVAH